MNTYYSLNLFSLYLLKLIYIYSCKQCGKPWKTPFESSRILRGETAPSHFYPWMVYMEISRKPITGAEEEIICGGTLITDQWVLTAAHCFQFSNTGQFIKAKIILGEYVTDWVDGMELWTSAEQIIVHEQYNQDKVQNDIALVKLNLTLDFKGKHKYLSPICLPKAQISIVGKPCEVSGWGHVLEGNEQENLMSNVLQVAKVPVRKYSFCSQKWGQDFNSRSQLCSGLLDGNEGEFCQGDSGGPLACLDARKIYVQHGIISYAQKNFCGSKTKPGVYTKVAFYMDWIQQNIGIDF